MKKILFAIPVLFILYGFYSNFVLEYTIKTLFQKIDITNESANDYIWNNISSNGFYFPNPKDLKDMAMGERASIVKLVGNYAKEFTKTEEFKSRYSEYRENIKPKPPEKPQTADEMRKQNKEQMTKSIQEMEKLMNSFPADQQATFEESIKSMKEQLKEVDDPNNPMYSSQMDEQLTEMYQNQLKEYDESVKQWEKDYPLDPKFLIVQWLNHFLETSKDVDFNAELKVKDGRKYFVKDEYEGKDYLWKICFRSGKTTTEAARDFAKSWLAEIK